MEKKQIKIFEENIDYIYEDNNKIKVIFVHGFNSSYQVTYPLIDLERNYDIVAMNLPVFNTNSEVFLSIEYLQNIVNEFINKLGFKEFILASHSLGAGIVLGVFSPNNLYTILLSPFNYYLTKYVDKTKLRQWLLPQNLEQVHESLISLVYDPNFKNYANGIEKIKQVYLNKISQKEKYLEYLVDDQILNDEYLKHDTRELFLNNNSRVQIISGVQDLFVPLESLKDVNHDTQWKLHEINDCGHAIIFEKAKEVNDLINKIIKENI